MWVCRAMTIRSKGGRKRNSVRHELLSDKTGMKGDFMSAYFAAFMRRSLWALVLIVPTSVLMTRLTRPHAAQANTLFSFTYNPAQNHWDMSNGIVHAAFDIDGNGKFGLVQFDDTGSNVWRAPSLINSSPISIQFGSTTYDATT